MQTQPVARRIIEFQIAPQLLTKQLGADLYSPGQALCQLVANSLDAGCSQVEIEIGLNELDAPRSILIVDDGEGVSFADSDPSFKVIGKHVQRSDPKRETIGSRGIGRFAVFALAVEAVWDTVTIEDDLFVRHLWTMREGPAAVEVLSTPAETQCTGTSITLTLKQTSAVLGLFSSAQSVKIYLFNHFAGYLLRYDNNVSILVNGEQLDPSEFVEKNDLEHIPESEEIPEATLHHLVLGAKVEQEHSNVLRFATHGTTISSRAIDGEPIPGHKYLGLIDSLYLSELTNTAKSDLAHLDRRFLALEEEALKRAYQYILTQRAGKTRSFLEEARQRDYYPFRVID